jgi:hypothetical protein
MPEHWEYPAFVCGHCQKTVNTADALPVATIWVQCAVWLIALGLGYVLHLVQSLMEGKGGEVTFDSMLTFGGATYLTVVGAFHWLGMTADAYSAKRGLLRDLLFVFNIPGALILILSGGMALFNAIELRPSFVVGLLLFWFSVRGLRHTQISSTKSQPSPQSSQTSEQPAVLQTMITSEPLPVFSASINEVLMLARAEAAVHKQDHVGTQHLLLALSRLDTRPAGQALLAAGITTEKLRVALASHLEPSMAELPPGELPLTPTILRTLELAESLARNRGVDQAQAEDLLKVLLMHGGGIAAEAVIGLGVDVDRVFTLLSISLCEMTRSPGRLSSE